MTTAPATTPTAPAPTAQRGRAWIALLVAGAFEVGYALSVNGSTGFTDPLWSVVAVGISAGNANGFKHAWWTVATLVSGAIATFFLSLALLTFDVGVGYALWTSLAGVGIVVVGALFLAQRLTWRKLLGIAVVIVGVVGLNLAGAH